MNSPSLPELGLLRRLAQGDLRHDGVTDFQSGVLSAMRCIGWVEICGSFWTLTDKGRAAIDG